MVDIHLVPTIELVNGFLHLLWHLIWHSSDMKCRQQNFHFSKSFVLTNIVFKWVNVFIVWGFNRFLNEKLCVKESNSRLCFSICFSFVFNSINKRFSRLRLNWDSTETSINYFETDFKNWMHSCNRLSNWTMNSFFQ